MEEIRAWLLDTRDFAVGKRLYNTYAPRYRENGVLAMQINLSENSLSRDLLIQELKAIAETVTVAKAPKKESRKYFANATEHDLPADLTELAESIPLLYKNRDFHRYKCRELKSGKTLLESASMAVKYDLKIREIYKTLDFYQRTATYPPGYVTQGPDQEDGQVAMMTRWLFALKRYPIKISRLNAKPEHADEVARMRKVLDDINKFLADADPEK